MEIAVENLNIHIKNGQPSKEIVVENDSELVLQVDLARIDGGSE